MRAIATRITELFGARFPVVQGGMIWASGWRLAAAVSNAGGLGLLGSGSMEPHILAEHIEKVKAVCAAPFGVNVPVSHRHAAENVDVALRAGLRIFFTSAGSPKKFTGLLKSSGALVVHVVPSAELARKAEAAGCDAVVAEGTEAGGHNGFEEITSINLWPHVAASVRVPVIAAGGVTDGRALAAALCLGCEGVQIGTRFAASSESSANSAYKAAILAAKEADARLFLRRVMPTRSIANAFVSRAVDAECRGATQDELSAILGRGRARLGIFEGDVEEGDLEAGQCAGRIDEILDVSEIVKRIVEGYALAVSRLPRPERTNPPTSD